MHEGVALIALVTAFAVAQFVSLTEAGDMDWMAVFGTLLYAGLHRVRGHVGAVAALARRGANPMRRMSAHEQRQEAVMIEARDRTERYGGTAALLAVGGRLLVLRDA